MLDFPGQRTIELKGKVVRVYFPQLNQYQEYDLGDKSQMINQFLLLGFGSSGKDLAGAYEISSEGNENVGDQPATKLQLVPKDAKVKEQLQRVELWIPADQAYPVRQQFYEPSRNWRKVTYSDIKLNPPIKGNLEFKLPRNAKKQSK
ncbi:MAG: outer membrane lipoprotein carrier protein LolA [Acidobacteriaceae bacterium]|nr:outer membrane lipoprotein carrier protein LolA [Acidobacteriaceae bacterium]